VPQPAVVRQGIGRTAAGVAEAGWLAVVALTAVYVQVDAGPAIESSKAHLLRALALIIAAAWLVSHPACRAAPPDRWRRLLGGAVGMLVIASVLSTLLSIAPVTSVVGSAARAQGLLTLGSIVVVGGVVADRLRRPDQWERLVTIAATVAVLVAVVAILQANGDDPFPSARSGSRPSSTVGTPIALAAWLVAAGALLAGRLASRTAELPVAINARRSAPIGVAVLSFGAWLFGPLPGAVVSCALVVLGRAVAARRSVPGALAAVTVDATALGVVAAAAVRAESVGVLVGLFAATVVMGTAVAARLGRPRIAALVVVAAVTVVLFGLTVAVTDSSQWRQAPLLRRVAAVEVDEGTLGVRIVLWDVALRAATADAALWSPTGADPHRRFRWLVGHGPDASLAPLTQFAPPRLWHLEDPAALPDRAHNATLDHLVESGAVGAAAHLTVVTAVVALALARLGLLTTARRRRSWIGAWVCGGTGGVVVAVSWGSPALSGAAMAGGAVIGLVGWLCAIARFSPAAAESRSAAASTVTLSLLVVAVVHWIETQSGISTIATSSLTAVAVGALASPLVHRASQAAPPVAVAERDRCRPAAFDGVAALAGAAVGLVAGAVVRGPGIVTSGRAAAIAVVVLIAALLRSQQDDEAAARPVLVAAVFAVTVALPAVVLQNRLDLTAAVTGPVLVLSLVLVTAVVVGAQLAHADGRVQAGPMPWRGSGPTVVVAAMVAVALLGVAPTAATVLRAQAPARADPATALRWLEVAHGLDRWADDGHLALGRARLAVAAAAPVGRNPARGVALAEAARALERYYHRHPFDPSRTEALVDLESGAARLVKSPRAAHDHRAAAARHAAHAVRMQPGSGMARLEHADALRRWAELLPAEAAAVRRTQADVEQAAAERLARGRLRSGDHQARPGYPE
jgi:hypothetical protein